MKNHFKLIFIILLLNTVLYSKANFVIHNKKIINAQSILITVKDKDISNIKLSLNKFNLNFLKNPFKKYSYYALLPISYYEKIKNQKIIISYYKNNKKIFTSLKINIKEGDYKKEFIKVSKKKVTLNKKSNKRASREYKEAYKIYNTKTKDLLWTKDFIKPLNSKITSNFGTKRLYNNVLKSYHSGVDLKAKINTKILASNAGIIVISKNRFYAGNSIVINHGHGVYTGYYHLNKLLKKVGDKVTRGEVVGLSGSTGRVTGPHLHFSAKVNGITVNGFQLISILNELND